jgi:hypothetical protein
MLAVDVEGCNAKAAVDISFDPKMFFASADHGRFENQSVQQTEKRTTSNLREELARSTRVHVAWPTLTRGAIANKRELKGASA